MNVLGIIPARYDSSRFPGKPLALIGSKPMIQWVYEQASKATSLHNLVVATDDKRILAAVEGFGGRAVLTSSEHKSGTDRCNEAVGKTGGSWDAVINIQGDEPFIDPKQIDLVVEALAKDSEAQIATLVKRVEDAADLTNENIVKAVISNEKRALYFSRTALPFYRGIEIKNWLKQHTYYKHIGIYGYKGSTLKDVALLKVSSLELAEKLEQLRWLENGYHIQVGITDIETIGVDTPEDLEKLRTLLAK